MMRGGDLSNVVAPTILLDLDAVIKRKEEPIVKGIGKALISFLSPGKPIETEYEVNRRMRDILIYIFNNHDVHICLFSFDLDWEYREDYLHRLLFNNYVPYNRVVFAVDEMDLTREKYLYLFTDKEDLISVLAHTKSMHIDSIMEVLK